jgi:hypothetical protein
MLIGNIHCKSREVYRMKELNTIDIEIPYIVFFSLRLSIRLNFSDPETINSVIIISI